MLKAMRHHAKYFYVLFFIVILTFIFWGVGTVDKTDRTTIAAEVGKYKITSEEYWRSYDRTFNFYRDLYKAQFTEEVQKKLNLKEGVLNALIENRVLLIAAKKYGIEVGDEELNEAIRTEAAFMKNGAFDSDIYINRLRLSRTTPEAYETARRQELIVEKTRRFIALSAGIPEEFSSIAGVDEKTLASLRNSLIEAAREKAVKAYVDGLKKDLKITINQDVITG